MITGVPGLLSFLVAASELASDIQLALPPVNLEALLHCFCGKLDLPMVRHQQIFFSFCSIQLLLPQKEAPSC